MSNELSGPLPTRKSFPFLRESTRREMDDRIEAARRGCLEAEKPSDDQKIELPRAPKKAAQKGLF